MIISQGLFWIKDGGPGGAGNQSLKGTALPLLAASPCLLGSVQAVANGNQILIKAPVTEAAVPTSPSSPFYYLSPVCVQKLRYTATPLHCIAHQLYPF